MRELLAMIPLFWLLFPVPVYLFSLGQEGSLISYSSDIQSFPQEFVGEKVKQPDLEASGVTKIISFADRFIDYIKWAISFDFKVMTFSISTGVTEIDYVLSFFFYAMNLMLVYALLSFGRG